MEQESQIEINCESRNLEIESELRLLKALGYQAIGPDGSNRWKILDKENNLVGFIQKKKLHDQKEKKGWDAVYGYQTKIESPEIHHTKIREVSDRRADSSYIYELDILEEKEQPIHVQLEMGETPSLTIWSEKYGFISFNISHNQFYLNVKSSTESFNIEETNLIKLSRHEKEENEFHKEYSYTLTFCEKSEDVEETEEKETYSICFNYKPGFYEDDQNLEIKERIWKNGKQVKNKTTRGTGTLEDAIVGLEMGLDSFQYFRNLMNEILPFEQDVIATMVARTSFKEREYALFVPELMTESSNKILEK